MTRAKHSIWLFLLLLLTGFHVRAAESIAAPSGNHETGMKQNRSAPENLRLTEAKTARVAEHDVIRVGFPSEFRPIFFKENGVYKGIFPDHLNLVAEQTGLVFEQVEIPARNLDRFLEEGRVDMSVGFSIPGRESYLMYTRPVFDVNMVVIGHNRMPVVNSLAALEGKTMAVVRGIRVYQQLLRDYPGIRQYPVETSRAALEAVASGKADAFMSGMIALGHLFQDYPSLKILGPAGTPPLPCRYLVRRDFPELVGVVNQAIDAIPEEAVDAIVQKWFVVRVAGPQWRLILAWVAGVSAVFGIILVLFYTWNKRLAREVSQRKRAEAAREMEESRLQALLELSQMAQASLEEITGFALESGVRLTGSEMGYLAFMNEDETILTMHAWSAQAIEQCHVQNKTLVYPVEKTGLWGEAARQRKPVVTNDYSAPNPLKKGCPEGHARITRHMGVPVFDGDRIVAVAGVGNKATDYDQADIRQLTLMMQGMWRLVQRRRDNEEKTRLEIQLMKSQKLESIGTLAGGIAHDFNNILASILGYTELSLEGVEKESLLEENLLEIFTAGKRARELVKQILAFARQSDEEKKPIQVGVIAREVVKLMRSSIPAFIRINSNIKSDSIIMGNPTQVYQILMNLCTNAAQAMEEEGGTLTVTVKDKAMEGFAQKPPDGLPDGNYVALSVSDTGHGIPADIIDTIFEPYFTTKGPGEGTGMGLAMAHGIVESYGGKIMVSSIPGAGTTFTVYFPIGRSRKSVRTPEAESLPGGTESVLFVDDEVPIAKIGSRMLEQLGYSVTTRTSSVEALELFRARPGDFDLVITDMTMPNMTGDRLAVELMGIRPDIPVIVCTGYSKKISQETIAAIGVRMLIHKPIVKADLAEAVRQVLDEPGNHNYSQKDLL